jgi:hypothetical protein
MDSSSKAAARIQQIEAQQDEILRQLEELERRTESVLAEHAPAAQRDVNATTDLAKDVATEPATTATPDAA